MADTKTSLPYGTYGMLKGTVERFVDVVVPTSLNRHVLDVRTVSGGDYSALISGLRFLGLINEDRTVRPEFHALVKAKKQSESAYQAALIEIVTKAYAPVIGDFDLDAGTLPDLEKKFRDASGYQGQMLTKAIRFYVKALEDCGVKISEHVTKPRPRTTSKNKGTKTQKKATKGGVASDDKSKEFNGHGPPPPPVVPSGFQRIAIPSDPNAFVQFPMAITERDCDQFEGIMDMLRRFAGVKRTEDKKP